MMAAMAHEGVPDGKNATSLGKVVLLLDAADPLLKDGGDLGGGGLSLGGVRADGVGERRGAGLMEAKSSVSCCYVRQRALIQPAQQIPIHQQSFMATPMASPWAYNRRRRWLERRQAQWQAVAMDLPTQSCSRQRLPRPGGSTGGWPLRTFLQCSRDY
jgi:hypothetical protein